MVYINFIDYKMGILLMKVASYVVITINKSLWILRSYNKN